MVISESESGQVCSLCRGLGSFSSRISNVSPVSNKKRATHLRSIRKEDKIAGRESASEAFSADAMDLSNSFSMTRTS